MKRFIDWFKRVILGRINKYGMTNNETKLYFKILKSLSKDSFINKKEITHLLARYLPKQNFENLELVTQYENNLIDFAGKIQKADHIVYDKDKLGIRKKDDGIIFSSLRIRASLTPNGLIFLNNYLDRKAKIRNRWFQVVIAALTTIFIGLTALYAYLSYSETLKKDAVKPQITMQHQSQKSKTMPQQQIKTKPYPIIQHPPNLLQNPQKKP